jgi:sec-independent protein translocase protein TatC
MSDEPESDDGDPVGPDEDTTPDSDPDVDSAHSADHGHDDRSASPAEATANADGDADAGRDAPEDATAGDAGDSGSADGTQPADPPEATGDPDEGPGEGGSSAGADATDESVPPHDRADVEVPTPRPDHHRDRNRRVESDAAGGDADAADDDDTNVDAADAADADTDTDRSTPSRADDEENDRDDVRDEWDDDDEADDEVPSYARLGTETDREGADSASEVDDEDDDSETVTGDNGDAVPPADDALAGYDPAEDDVVATDGEGAGAGAGATVDAAAPAVEDEEYTPGYLDDGAVDGPEDDVEMPLTDHIEEMIRRLAVVFFVGGLVTLFLFPGSDLTNFYLGTDLPTATNVINHLWDKHIPGTQANAERRPRLYGPLELVLTELKVAGLGGLVFGLPAFVYETYLFMRPGLYPKERRYYLAAVPTSVVLAAIGVAFAHFAVLPAIFAYFTSYTTGTAVVAFGLAETFNLIIILMGYMAIVFQIPLFIMLAIMMDLVTSQWLRERRLLFWGAFLGISFIATPDPTGMAPIIVGATMIVLFEGTLGALRYTRH